MIFVSHDRYFVNKVADSLLIFEDGDVKYFNGTYEEYLNKKNIEEQRLEEKNSNVIRDNEKPKKENEYFAKKEKNRMQNRLKKLEEEISSKEGEIRALEEEMQKEEVCSDYIELTRLQEELKTKNSELEESLDEWEDLNKKLGEN